MVLKMFENVYFKNSVFDDVFKNTEFKQINIKGEKAEIVEDIKEGCSHE